MQQVRVSPPTTSFDGWYLTEHISNTVGMPLHKRISYDQAAEEVVVEVAGLDQAIIDAIPAAVASYVAPAEPSPTKTRDIILAYM